MFFSLWHSSYNIVIWFPRKQPLQTPYLNLSFTVALEPVNELQKNYVTPQCKQILQYRTESETLFIYCMFSFQP